MQCRAGQGNRRSLTGQQSHVPRLFPVVLECSTTSKAGRHDNTGPTRPKTVHTAEALVHYAAMAVQQRAQPERCCMHHQPRRGQSCCNTRINHEASAAGSAKHSDNA